jgi:single-strand DNA-binding protein
LLLDHWDDKTTGQKRSKHKIVVESLQLLEGRANDTSQNLAAHDEFPASSTRGMAASERDSRFRGHSAQQRGELADASDTDSPNPGDDEIPF